MKFKGLAVVALLWTITQAPGRISGQATDHSTANPQNSPSAASSSTGPPATAAPAVKTECNGGPCEDQQPRVIVTVPAPTPGPWLLRDRITWGANLVLVILGYVGIMMGVSTLRKIERQTKSGEAAAQAAADGAQAALLQTQALVSSERPWVLISVEPSLSIQNGFTIVATNRGRTPASVLSTAQQIRIAVDETHLPGTPEFSDREPGGPQPPIILLPGESTGIKPFCRDDVKGLCESEERLKRVENWEEKIFIYGRVIYRDLTAPADRQIHETAWCCWYIHGRQKSGLVIDGPREYNYHT